MCRLRSKLRVNDLSQFGHGKRSPATVAVAAAPEDDEDEVECEGDDGIMPPAAEGEV